MHDIKSERKNMANKISSILITGATGYFGNGFVKTILDRKIYDRVCIYSRDEYKQAQMRERFNNDGRLRWFIGDVRDLDRLTRAMHGVDIVIHAAALKRIETGFYNPEEMVKTNVIGAMNVIEAARLQNISRVIALSTDKAFESCSAYGHSKAMAESLFLAANNNSGDSTDFFCVRYGNVWNSTGSILPKWKQIISNGSKFVPVTSPDCTRFFMLLSEAVDLVLHTIFFDREERLIIPETLPAYRVGDLADALGVGMEVVGMPSFEKMHEGMRPGLTSDIVRRLSVDELREELRHV